MSLNGDTCWKIPLLSHLSGRKSSASSPQMQACSSIWFVEHLHDHILICGRKTIKSEESQDFPGREEIQFGDVVQAPPKLTAPSKV
ncbi:hypothetical protein Peur_022575 [Populus x canadensis]